uniref:Polyphenol oxidase n=1 Tax=Trifolium pratense TaxID=57577 RepID=Q84YI0_TRIPR|nr:polyphenol oxidase [Trifolium pratense]
MVSISSSPLSLMSFNVSFNFNTSSSLLYPFSQKQHQPSKNKKPKHHKIACTSNDTNQNSPKEQEQKPSPSNIVGHRRNVLIGLGGLYGATTLTNNNSLAFADPVPIPDLTKCVIPPTGLPNNITPFSCCPPISSNLKIIDFEFPTFKKLRVRRAAHLNDSISIDNFAKYDKALNLMKALPDDDPRSFVQQAKVHCAYCVGGYTQKGYPNTELQVHFSWLFLPFHRWYLYFYERILGSLINDPTFAIPFWNWDAPDGMTAPSIFTDPNSSLFDPKRNPKHVPPKNTFSNYRDTIVDLNYNKDFDVPGTINPRPEVRINENLTWMYKQMICHAKTYRQFLGSRYRGGEEPLQNNCAGSIESLHNHHHVWVGDRRQPNGEDMGHFYSSGRDPLFYAHHANVDRMWSVWQTLRGKRKDCTENDWLESSFLFYDENKNLVKVKVKDSVDDRKLGYVYQNLDIPWINHKPKPSKRVQSKDNKLLAQRPLRKFVDKFPIVLDSAVSIIVKRPKKSRSLKQKEVEEEILVIDGIEFDDNIGVMFDVLVNDDDDKVIGVENSEFLGSFLSLPHGHNHGNNKKKEKKKTCFTRGLTDLLEDLKADDDDSIVVTLIPRYGDGVKISGIEIDFEE